MPSAPYVSTSTVELSQPGSFRVEDRTWPAAGERRLRLRVDVGRLPGDRLDRRIVAGAQPARLGHDQACSLLEHLPVRAILDAGLVALHGEELPGFPLVCECVLQRHASIALTLTIFDALSVDREPVVSWPYLERRRISSMRQG
jgi:hypothetical protein